MGEGKTIHLITDKVKVLLFRNEVTHPFMGEGKTIHLITDKVKVLLFRCESVIIGQERHNRIRQQVRTHVSKGNNIYIDIYLYL
nr:hypothetical protein Q903MT_gene765 [Picea sitchensis]